MELRRVLVIRRILSSSIAKLGRKFAQTWQMCLLIPRIVRIFREAGLSYLFLSTSLSVYDGVAPVVSIWLTKLLIDSATLQWRAEEAGDSVDLNHLAFLVGIQLVIWLVASVADIFARPFIAVLGERGSHITRRHVSETTSRVPYICYEDSSFYDRIEAARKAQEWPEYSSLLFFQMVTSVTRLASTIVLMAFIGWWVAPVIILTMLPHAIARGRYIAQSHHLFHYQSADRRQLNYFTELLAGRQAAKEVRLFDLSEFWLRKYSALWEKCYEERRRLFISRHGVSLLADLPGVLSAGVIYFYLLSRAVGGVITLGELAMGLGVTLHLRTATSTVAHNIIQVFRASLLVMDYFKLIDMRNEVLYDSGGDFNEEAHLEIITSSRHDKIPIIRLQDVSFRYPGASEDALRKITLDVNEGEIVALVGHNGAGKTTLVKLISGLLAPYEGSIWFRGREVDSTSMKTLRRNVSVVFQDFGTYDLTLRDNITIGNTSDDASNKNVMSVCHDAGLRAVVSKLPQGFDTMLGRSFGGQDLSVGEWQHVALARCLFKKDAQILVLDEPTASLDAEAEYHLYKRLSDISSRKTTFLISHRCSTVRAASRIVVIERGEIVEDGSHSSLLAAQGIYAKIYSMQAERFQHDDL